MPLSPEALAKIADAIPETYETNPEQFAQDFAAMQAARAEAERLKPIGEWFDTTYKPWFTEHGKDFNEFQQWKETRAQGTTPTTTTTSTTTPTPGYDFSTADEPIRHLYEHVEHRLDDATTKLNTLEATIATRTEELQRLFALQEQAYQLVNEDTWRELGRLKQQPDWKPNVNIPEVVDYARKNSIGDLRTAYTLWSEGDRMKALEQAAYERGKHAAEEEARRAQAAATTTTENVMGGVPIRHAMPPGVKRGYGNVGLEDIMAGIQARRAARLGGTGR
jgi:hypothetical protein